MSRMTRLLSVQVIPNSPRLHKMLEWCNCAVIPLSIIIVGVRKVYATASTPFEQFFGTMVVVIFAMLWPIFVRSLAPRRATA